MSDDSADRHLNRTTAILATIIGSISLVVAILAWRAPVAPPSTATVVDPTSTSLEVTATPGTSSDASPEASAPVVFPTRSDDVCRRYGPAPDGSYQCGRITDDGIEVTFHQLSVDESKVGATMTVWYWLSDQVIADEKRYYESRKFSDKKHCEYVMPPIGEIISCPALTVMPPYPGKFAPTSRVTPGQKPEFTDWASNNVVGGYGPDMTWTG